jgi:hypothetical protein
VLDLRILPAAQAAAREQESPAPAGKFAASAPRASNARD